MSFLTPLFLAGFAAIAAPILFHLIRQTPSGEQRFSSLMFLSPSPPRLTRRSRLDNLLLLLLRAAALALIALAFSRPFLRQAARSDQAEPVGRRLAIVLDRSASMRRGDLWARGAATVDAVLGDLQRDDAAAVFLCDDALTPVMTFAESAQLDPQQRRAAVAGRLAEVEPSWRGTHLGAALLEAAAAVSESIDAEQDSGRTPRRIVLVTDLQEGGRFDLLDGVPWPSDVEVETRRLAPPPGANAGLERLADAEASQDADGAIRLRVWNEAGATREQFRLSWIDEEGDVAGEPIDAYAPAGESRVFEATPPPGTTVVALRLAGDQHEFDNQLFVAAPRRDQATIIYFGADSADDQDGLRYFLQRAAVDPSRGDAAIRTPADGEPLVFDEQDLPDLLVVTQPLGDEAKTYVRDCVVAGATALVVVTEAETAGDLAFWLGESAGDEPPAIAEAEVADYQMWSEIDFSHPLFAPMAGPQFNDFTQIRFWAHRSLDVSAWEATRVLARFDDGDPALVETSLGQGELYVMTASWRPSESQLALSWKFVRLVSGLIHGAGRSTGDWADIQVGQSAAAAMQAAADSPPQILHADGTPLAPSGDGDPQAIETPGLYRVVDGETEATFAVNLDPRESRTAPLAADTLEQWGVTLAGAPAAIAAAERDARQLRDAELESKQDVWRWLIVAALAVLGLETLLAGRLSLKSIPTVQTVTP